MKKKTFPDYISLNVPYLDAEYDSEYSCEESRCDDYCRCRRITNVRLIEEEVLIDVNNIIIHLNGKIYARTEIEDYCLGRLMSHYKMWDVGQYEREVEGGYYGDELGETKFAKEPQLKEDIWALLKLGAADQVKFVLQKEYSYLLDTLKNCTEAKVVKLDIETLRKANDYFLRLKNEEKNFTAFGEILGVVFEGRLIDGYHRTARCKSKVGKYIELCD